MFIPVGCSTILSSFIQASSSERIGRTSKAMLGTYRSHCARSVFFVCFSRVLWCKWNERVERSFFIGSLTRKWRKLQANTCVAVRDCLSC